jgi:hypothetical protein
MFAPYACMAHTPKLTNGFRNLAQFLTPQTRAAPETKIPDSPTTSLLAAGGEERIVNSTAWILTGQRRVCASVDGYRSRSSPSQVTVVQIVAAVAPVAAPRYSIFPHADVADCTQPAPTRTPGAVYFSNSSCAILDVFVSLYRVHGWCEIAVAVTPRGET